MRVSFFVLCIVAVSLAQLSLNPWQGTWSEGKRNFGGSLYMCANGNHIHGSYSGAGLIYGNIQGNRLVGEWYEAGYFTPYGTFELTIGDNGNSFSGTWTYAVTGETFSWTGSKSSSTRPSNSQCIVPSNGGSLVGSYANGMENLCFENEDKYETTTFPLVNGYFTSFGVVQGYSMDNGKSAFLSNFAASSSMTAATGRPENNPDNSFGPGPKDFILESGITTDKIVIGAIVDGSTFCGYFWDGFYNNLVGDQAICFSRDSLATPTDEQCGVNMITRQQITAANDGKTQEIISEVQRALNNLAFVDDEGNLTPFVPPPPTSDDDDDNIPSPPPTGTIDDDNDDNGNSGNGRNNVDDDDENEEAIILIIYTDDDGHQPAQPVVVGDDDDNNGGFAGYYNNVENVFNNFVINYMDDDDAPYDDPNAPFVIPVPLAPQAPINFIPGPPTITTIPGPFNGNIVVAGSDDDDNAAGGDNIIIVYNEGDGSPIVVPQPGIPSGFDNFLDSSALSLSVSFGLIIFALLI